MKDTPKVEMVDHTSPMQEVVELEISYHLSSCFIMYFIPSNREASMVYQAPQSGSIS